MFVSDILFWFGIALIFCNEKRHDAAYFFYGETATFCELWVNPTVGIQQGVSFQPQREPPFDVGSLWFQWCYESICWRGTFISAVSQTPSHMWITSYATISSQQAATMCAKCCCVPSGSMTGSRGGVSFSSWGGPCDSCFNCKSQPRSSQYLLWLSPKNIWLELWLRVAMFMSSGYDWVLDGSIYCWKSKKLSVSWKNRLINVTPFDIPSFRIVYNTA